jgi:hypothetical protein
MNKGRHILIRNDTNDIIYYAVYKREYFNTFSKKFPDFIRKNPSMCMIGESINSNFLDIAIRKGVYQILFIHPNKIYSCFPLFFKKFAEKNNLIRTQNKLNIYFNESTYEKTYSIPLNLLERFDK